MPTSPILSLLFSIIYYLFESIVIIKFVLPSHHSESDFPFKHLVISQVGVTHFIMFMFCLVIF